MQQVDNFYTPPNAPASEVETLYFSFERLLGGKYFVQLVQVILNNGDGTIDVMPLVMQQDIAGNPIENSQIYNIPYGRIQMGGSAIKMNPKAGDFGLIAVCDKDSTLAKTTKSQSAAPTRRNHSLSDAVYICGIAMMNAEPTQYIEFLDSGINVKSSGDVNINGLKISSSGTLTLVDGSVVDKHTHGGVESGGSKTNPLGA